MGSKLKRKKKVKLPKGKYKKKIGKAHQIQTECKLCGEFFMASREREKNHVALSRHLYERHTLAEGNACDICGNKYSDKKGLVRHLLFIHLEYRPYKCRLCDREFARRDLFRIHLSKTHPECDKVQETVAGSASWNPERELSSTINKTNALRYAKTSAATSITNYFKETSDWDKYFVPECVICNITLYPPTRASLSKHIKAKHPESKLCQKCGTQFADRKGLLRHYRTIHFDFRPYSCTLCSKTFARKDRFTYHTLQHHTLQERSELFECDKCEKVFVERFSLTKHFIVCRAPEGKVKVERILDKREVNGRVEYLIKWEGYDESESTWEAEDAITGRRDEKEDGDSEAESSMDDNEEGGSDIDDYLDELYAIPHLCTIDIGVI